jgi:hypothetical protein
VVEVECLPSKFEALHSNPSLRGERQYDGGPKPHYRPEARDSRFRPPLSLQKVAEEALVVLPVEPAPQGSCLLTPTKEGALDRDCKALKSWGPTCTCSLGAWDCDAFSELKLWFPRACFFVRAQCNFFRLRKSVKVTNSVS